jgi:hypothetical protein
VPLVLGEEGGQEVKRRRLTARDKSFYLGIIAALGVVKLFDNGVLFDEIVATCNVSELVTVAKENEDMEWSGLAKYGYGRYGRRAKRLEAKK